MKPVQVVASFTPPRIQSQKYSVGGLHEGVGWGRMHQLGGATKSGDVTALKRPLAGKD